MKAFVISHNSKSKINKKIKLIDITEELERDDIANNYNNIRSRYSSSEYVPSNVLEIIMKHHFNSSELLFSYNENHNIYKIKIGDLLVDKVRNWEFNRPPDMVRCPDIARYIYNTRKPIDTILYLSYNNLNEVFEVIDGIHRITALKIIKEQNSKPLDLLENNDFGSGNDATWLYNQYILVNIRFNATVGDLIEAFKNLNKSQVVPDLYIRGQDKEKRNIIDAIANEWVVKYKRHFSSSIKPNVGNTNRNKFVDLLDKLYEKHNIDMFSSDKLRNLLNNANIEISKLDKLIESLSSSVNEKCKETGCYLFLLRNDKLEEMI